MSRIHTDLSGNVTKTVGQDHAVGNFVQVTDKRWARNPEDIQGKGFVLDWDELSGFSINLIGAEKKDLKNNTKLLVLCDDFARQTAVN